MTDRILRYAFLGLGAVSGSFAAVSYLVDSRLGWLPGWARIAAAIVLGALVGLFFVSLLFRIISFAVLRSFSALEQASAVELMAGAVGLITALLIGVLLTFPLPRQLPIIGPYLPSLVTAVFGYVGLVVATRKSREISELLPVVSRPARWRGWPRDGGVDVARPKVLDTSVVMDGRIFDVLQTGVVEGRLVVPKAVLAELQHIADAAESLRRARGRRGLELLDRLRRELHREVEVDERDWPGVEEVDDQIVRLAKAIGGTVVTNDYNLNKVCGVHGVPVLNLNDLANALKPAVLPGEELLNLQVLREGKEPGQGVGYLADGTMVVVEGGRRFIGEAVDVVVTSVIQTAAGRMIFGRPQNRA
ncbi:MAG: TRAM domain-containing protein [Bacillota bacterium]|nr:TRAM domain-containing protein [Bacillota bacterium]